MSIEDEMRALTAYEEEKYGDPYAYEHGVRPVERPTVIALKIRGQMNNLTVAAAIYEAFTMCREPIDLFEVANMLQSQVRADNNREWRNSRGECKEED